MYEQTGLQTSLATMNGPEWHRLRQAIKSRMLPPKSAVHYLPAQNQVATEFVERIRTRNFTKEQLADEYFKVACESIGVMCYNARLGCFSSDPDKQQEMTGFINNLNTFFRIQFITNTAFPFYKYFRTKTYDTYENAFLASSKVGRGFFDSAITEIKRKLDSGNTTVDDSNFLMGLLTEGKLTEDEMFGIVSDLFLGGIESVLYILTGK